MEKSNIVSFASFKERKPVLRLIDWPMSVIRNELQHYFFNNYKKMLLIEAKMFAAILTGDDKNLTFAHVLNFPESEDIWPGDAAKLLYPELFACRLSNEWLYVDASFIAEHFRCETQRLCSGGFYELSYFEYDFYHHSECRSFPDSLFGDDGDDEDTLDSELLLTQEYEPPKR